MFVKVEYVKYDGAMRNFVESYFNENSIVEINLNDGMVLVKKQDNPEETQRTRWIKITEKGVSQLRKFLESKGDL